MESDHIVTREDEKVLLGIARSALCAYLRSGKRVSVTDLDLGPALTTPRGAFVTLRNGAELRGCIGSVSHSTALAETVINSVVRSASKDPRFDPVTVDELDDLRIEISILGDGESESTPFIPVAHIHEIVIGRDGLYIEHPSNASGLLLPQVAVDRDWDTGKFLQGLCQKAGLPEGAWREGESCLYRFTAQVFSEESKVSTVP